MWDSASPFDLPSPNAEFIETQSFPTAELQKSMQVLQYFWGPYLAPGQSSLLVHTEPLFFREGWQTYVRNLYVNDPGKGYPQLIERLPELKARELYPSYHYLGAGEVNSMFLFMHFFHALGVPVSVRNARITSWHEMRQSNLVMVGCTRTNPFMDMLQEETNFIITEDEICNLKPSNEERQSYKGERYNDSNWHVIESSFSSHAAWNPPKEFDYDHDCRQSWPCDRRGHQLPDISAGIIEAACYLECGST